MLLLLLPALGFLVSPLATVPALASKIGIVCPRVSFRLAVYLSCPWLSPCLSLSCPCYPFPSCLSLAQYPSALTCPGSCAAQGHHRFTVPASTLGRKHARLGKTHDLPREPLSGDHGKLVARVPSQSLLEPLAGGLHPPAVLYCATSFSQEASMSPRSRPSLCIYSHLARGLRIPLKSAAVRCPPLLLLPPPYSSLSTRRTSSPKRRGTKDTRDRALPSHFVMSKARTVLLIVTLFASRPSCVM